jgi:hypothetical protein
MRGRKLAAVGTILGLVVGAATMAAATAIHHPQRVSVGPLTSLTQKAGPVSAVSVTASDFNDISNSSTTLSQLPGMKTTVHVPLGTSALLDIRFTAETACYGGGNSSNWCIAEILVDGVEASPGDGGDYALDSTDNGTESAASWEGHAMEREIVVGAGKHVVTVVGGVTDFGGTRSQVFWTGERSLVAQRSLI